MRVGNMRTVAAAACVLAALTFACGDDGGADAGGTDADSVVTTEGRGGASEFQLLSPAFDEEGSIPDEYAGRGGNISPPLVWRFPPEGRVEYVVVVDDPDAPGDEPFVHWMVAGIPASELNLAEGAVPDGAVEGRNGAGRVGWLGPAPPEGEVHTYRFVVHALGDASGLERGFDRDDLVAALDGNVLASASFTARYPGA